MKDVATTRLSSKGQDTIVLQRVRAPAMQDFDAIVARAREAARRAGMRQPDVAAAIEAVRST